MKENNPELFDKIKANVQNVTKSKISSMAPSKQNVEVAEQNMMFQKVMNEKKQMEPKQSQTQTKRPSQLNRAHRTSPPP